ncbi:MAG: transglycosylase SLT domain-containing protein [Crocinitomicaceae bacterium]|nr:transglycosylase SLT domain-containing protein [Crocinitomicaceae bacterium]
MRAWLMILFISAGVVSVAQNSSDSVKDSLNNIPFINTIEQSLNLFYAEYANNASLDSLKKAIEENGESIVKVSDDTICKRLARINSMTPFQLQCNETALSIIKYFIEKRKGFIKVVLGRSPLYFDMFEAKLSEYGLPIELKYLAVIESGLRPQVKSRAGALGLWQFMYRTGLYFGLKENSYIDERMDPVKATDAACRYLKKLFGIYGDWNLVLAAYNAGPGNVNKAIKRSGDKKTYWEVRPYLPSETQGYVPNFIAVTYLMTYHKEHLIAPVNINHHNISIDTMCFKSSMHMGTISKVIDWSLEDIKALNPIFKTTFIPKSNPPFCICGPHEKINLVVGMEDSLIKLEKSIYGSDEVQMKNIYIQDTLTGDTIQKTIHIYYHKVQAGEVLQNVAANYAVTEDQIMTWNGLKTTNIYIGQHLRIESEKKVTPPKPKPKPQTTIKYYTVRSGDTFGHIAERHRMSQSRLRKLNPRININRLDIGQKIRIR